MGWLLMKKHPDVRNKGKAVDMSDLEKDFVVVFQHR
jgi:stearoyl-CoA desaturase (delta-9 desaturase)